MTKSKVTPRKSPGRPRTLKADKLQKGSVNTTREKKRVATEMKVVKINEYPQAPEVLGEEGIRHWDVVVRELTDLRALSRLDLFNLQALCMEWEFYVSHRMEQKKTGSYMTHKNGEGGTSILPHPVHYNGTNHLREYTKLCNEFGLSPASRARIGLASVEPTRSKAANLLKKAV